MPDKPPRDAIDFFSFVVNTITAFARKLNRFILRGRLRLILQDQSLGIQRGTLFAFYSVLCVLVLNVLSLLDTWIYPYPDSYAEALQAFRLSLFVSMGITILVFGILIMGYLQLGRTLAFLSITLMLINQYIFVADQTNMDLISIMIITALPATIFSRHEISEMVTCWILSGSAFLILLIGDFNFIPLVSLDLSTMAGGRQGTLFVALIVSLFIVLIQLRNEWAMERLHQETLRSRHLLLNILPEEIADELVSGTQRISRQHKEISVVFGDLVGFTRYCTTVNADTVVGMLNGLFGAFDVLSLFFGVEKIKTIGDGYMAASSVPHAVPMNVERATLFSLACLKYVALSPLCTQNNISLRMGIHTGQAVAGVIGTHKFLYDIWGDTVNTASRMESFSHPMQLNVSAKTWSSISSHFVGEERPAIEVKGKGIMKTYFVQHLTEDTPDQRLIQGILTHIFGDIAVFEQNKAYSQLTHSLPPLSDHDLIQILYGHAPLFVVNSLSQKPSPAL